MEDRGEGGLQVLMGYVDCFRQRVWVVMKEEEGRRKEGEEWGGRADGKEERISYTSVDETCLSFRSVDRSFSRGSGLRGR